MEGTRAAFVAVVAMALLMHAGTASAYLYRWSVNVLNGNADPFLLNGTNGANLGDGIQYIWCNSTTNYLYYDNSTSYACYNGKNKIGTFIDEGNGTQYGLPEKDLILWLHMNGTDVYDSSMYRNAGTKYGVPTARPGKIGKGLYFDGIADNISYGDLNAAEGSINLSICLWVNMTDLNDSSFVSKWSGTNGFAFKQSGADAINMYIVTAGGEAEAIAPTACSLNTWYFACGVYDGETLRVYVNGVEAAGDTAPSGAITANTAPLSIGHYSTSDISGLIDEVRIYNRTLSAAEIMALKNSTHTDNYSYMETNETTDEYEISVTSPSNTTYSGALFASITYSLSNYSACDMSSYSLDGAANVSMDCVNSTVTFDAGFHYIIVYVLDDRGRLYATTVYFTATYATYTFNITDEMTYVLYNGTATTVTKLYVYCDESTETTTITSNPCNVTINCEFDEIRLEMVTVNNGTHWRTLHPVVYNGTLSFYMVNESADDAIEQTWKMYDVTGDYNDGFLVVTKAIGSHGVKTITEKLIDASGNAVLYLIPGERYCFKVYNSGMTSERNLGCLYATSETSTRTEISRVPYAPVLDLTYKDVFVYFSWDEAGAYIQGIYNDTLSLTSNVSMTVYNASNITQTMYSSSSTFNYVVFTYNTVDTDSEYIAVLTGTHSRYGTITEKKVISFHGAGLKPTGLATYGLEYMLGIAAGLICIIIMLAFTKKRQNLSIGVFVLFLIMFMYWGWFDEAPQLSWTILTLIAFIAIIGFFMRRENT